MNEKASNAKPVSGSNDENTAFEAEHRTMDAAEIEAIESSVREAIAGCEGQLDVEAALADAEGLDLWVAATGGEAIASSPELQRVAGLLLGRRLAHDLGLEWVADAIDGELGLRSSSSNIVFYPQRMAQSQLENWQETAATGEPGPRLGWLVASTRQYLKDLIRFHPSQPR